jgi:acetyl-CoA acetyltransferase
MELVVTASAARTAIGCYGGALKDVSAPELAAIVPREALRKAGLQATQVDKVVMRHVLVALCSADHLEAPGAAGAVRAHERQGVPRLRSEAAITTNGRSQALASGCT